MPTFEKISGGYRITLSDIDILPSYNVELPLICDVLTESKNLRHDDIVNILKMPSERWYNIFNECHAEGCCLNRDTSNGKFYREKVVDDIIHSSKFQNGCSIAILEPGCMLTDLEILSNIKDKNIDSLRIVHDYGTRDYTQIIDEVIQHHGTNTITIGQIAIDDSMRNKWAAITTYRIILLMGYALHNNINLTYDVIRFFMDYYPSTDCKVDIYIGVDYYDENYFAIIETNLRILKLSKVLDSFDVILCRTNGIYSREIIYAHFIMNDEVKNPKMRYFIDMEPLKILTTDYDDIMSLFKQYEIRKNIPAEFSATNICEMLNLLSKIFG